MTWVKIKYFSRKLPVTMLREKEKKWNLAMQANRRPQFSLTSLPLLLSTYLIFSQTLERREIVNLSPFAQSNLSLESWKIQKYWVSLEFRQQIALHFGYCHLSSVSRDCLIGSEEKRKGRKCAKGIKWDKIRSMKRDEYFECKIKYKVISCYKLKWSVPTATWCQFSNRKWLDKLNVQ